MLICEDAWHVTSPYLLTAGGANLLILPSNSPARSVTDIDHFGSQAFWRKLIQVYAQLFSVNMIFVNRVGFEDGVSFFGGSCVVSASGEWVAEAPTLEEALVFAEVDVQAVRRARFISGVARDEKPGLVLNELQRLQDEWRREAAR
jgi:predicted amidohydrolase